MTSTGLVLVGQEAVFIAIMLAYFLVSLIAYRFLYLRLAPSAKLLASVFLLAHVAVIVMSEITQQSPNSMYWLWNLDIERNVPTGLAATQLGVVGGVSLMNALFSSGRAKMQRLYFLGLGLVFFFLSYDEFFGVHEKILDWTTYYAVAGIALVSLMVAITRGFVRTGCNRFGPIQEQRWLFASLPAGLFLAAVGAIGFELHSTECGGWGYIFTNGLCIRIFVVEESLELLGIWFVLVGMLGLFSVLSPSRPLKILVYAWAVGLFATTLALIPIEDDYEDDYQKPYIETKVRFETNLQLDAYQVERFMKDSRLHVHVHLSPGELDFRGSGYSISLIDQASLASVARRNTYTHERLDSWESPDNTIVYRQWVEVEIPPDAPTNRALWLVLTLWREENGDFVRQNILSSDLQLLSDTQVILDEFVLKASTPLPETNTALASFENGFTLEDVELPERSRAGESMSIAVAWRSAQRSDDNYIQFLHLGHEESGKWFVYDQMPLGDRLPTTLWYNGLSDSETWQVPLPADMQAGRYAIFTGLYDVQDGERLIVRDVNGEPFLDSRVPLGSVIIQAS